MDLKYKLIRYVICLALGVPLTVTGAFFSFEWSTLKYARQLINCGDDASQAMLKITDSIAFDDAIKEYSNINKAMTQCRNNADLRKGNLAFFKDERARMRSGG